MVFESIGTKFNSLSNSDFLKATYQTKYLIFAQKNLNLFKTKEFEFFHFRVQKEFFPLKTPEK